MDDQSVSTIRTFLAITTKIAEHQKAIKELKLNLKGVHSTLMTTMKGKSLDEIETNNGQICYQENEVKKGYTPKYLVSLLEDYNKSTQTPINVSEIMKFLQSHRGVTVKENIKFKKK